MSQPLWNDLFHFTIWSMHSVVVVADEVGVQLGRWMCYREGSEYNLLDIPTAFWLIGEYNVNSQKNNKIFGPKKIQKSRRTAWLNYYIPIEFSRALNQKVSCSAGESLHCACSMGQMMCKIQVILYLKSQSMYQILYPFFFIYSWPAVATALWSNFPTWLLSTDSFTSLILSVIV